MRKVPDGAHSMQRYAGFPALSIQMTADSFEALIAIPQRFQLHHDAQRLHGSETLRESTA